ncbi:ubiquitin thioesterase otulin isoform 2-T2 [Leptodactylus fuscus]
MDTGEICTNHIQGIMAQEPKNCVFVEKKIKVSDGRLSLDPQPEVADSDETSRDSPSVTEQEHPENVGDWLKDQLEERPSIVPQDEKHDAVDIFNQIGTDRICSSSNSQKPESKTAGKERTVLKEQSVSTDEDLYRDEEEIKKEKLQKGFAGTPEKDPIDDLKLGVGPEVDIIEYCQREWRGKTTVARRMKEGYVQVSNCFGSIRRVRGDNYCALRATLFQCLSQTTKLPQWLADEDLPQLPEKLVKKYDWIKQWKLWHSNGSKKLWVWMKESLELLKKKWLEMTEIQNPDKKQAACDEVFQNEEEYCLYEAIKFLMLKTAIDLFNASEEGKEVPVFSWLLFARNTSNNPCEFLQNHLNHVGHSGGLEQVEMFLLGYALQHTIQVYRLYKYGTDEFITCYPNDQTNWPVVTLITEDDRHYNVPVRVCEETFL